MPCDALSFDLSGFLLQFDRQEGEPQIRLTAPPNLTFIIINMSVSPPPLGVPQYVVPPLPSFARDEEELFDYEMKSTEFDYAELVQSEHFAIK